MAIKLAGKMPHYDACELGHALFEGNATYIDEADFGRSPAISFSQDSAVGQRHGDAGTLAWLVTCAH